MGCAGDGGRQMVWLLFPGVVRKTSKDMADVISRLALSTIMTRDEEVLKYTDKKP